MHRTLICPRERAARFLERLPAMPWAPPDLGPDQMQAINPFPVSAPFEVRPDLRKLDGAPLFVVDSAWADWLQKKRTRLLSGDAGLLFAPDLTEEQLGLVTRLIRAVLGEGTSPGPVSQAGGLPWLGLDSGISPIDFLLGLTMSVQEDFAVMTPNADGLLKASVLSVCFPSGWAPAEKIGQSLVEIHAPVADNIDIQKSAAAMSQAMLEKGPFIRFVWTLAGHDQLWRRPGEDSFSAPFSLDRLWFRCERQVTVPLNGQASLFLIRVFITKLSEILKTPGHHQQLFAAVQSMSPEMLRYKGLAPIAHLFGR